MDEFLSLTLLSQPGELQAEFAGRLSRFWTHMLRHRQGDFEKVYAEATAFESNGSRLSRQYLIEPEAASILESELRTAGLDFESIDAEETFSRYEAVAPDWMQIEH